MLLEIRNHLIEDFLHCRRKFKLKDEGWESIETHDNLIIGKAVHAGLANWALTLDETKAHAEGFREVGEADHLTDLVFLLLNNYFQKYKDDQFIAIATETEFNVPFPSGGKYGVRTDGLIEYEKRNWVLERKTTGLHPATFWKMFRSNRQVRAYWWAAQLKYPELDIVGVAVDAIFKPWYKNPEPKYQREFFTDFDLTDWLYEEVLIVEDMKQTYEKDTFYKSRACFSRYNTACEFYEYCLSGGMPEVLRVTHKMKGKDGNV